MPRITRQSPLPDPAPTLTYLIPNETRAWTPNGSAFESTGRAIWHDEEDTDMASISSKKSSNTAEASANTEGTFIVGFLDTALVAQGKRPTFQAISRTPRLTEAECEAEAHTWMNTNAAGQAGVRYKVGVFRLMHTYEREITPLKKVIAT